MALRIELSSDKPGYAHFSAKKWTGTADIEVAIQRNQDGYYLSDTNQWTAEICWRVVSGLTVDNLTLQGIVEPWLVDSLVSQGGNVRFLMQIRDKTLTNTDNGVINIAADVFMSSAANSDLMRSDVAPVINQPTPVIESIVELPEIEPISEQEPEPEVIVPPPVPEKEKKKSKGIILAVIAIIILLLAALAWFLLKPTSNDTTQVQATGSCSLVSLDSNNELAFIQTCLKSKPTEQQLMTLITEAKAQNKCNIAQRLYANQSQINPAIAVMYAKEYDNKFYQKNNCFDSDTETAIYWYETALTKDPKNNVASDRLAELKN